MSKPIKDLQGAWNAVWAAQAIRDRKVAMFEELVGALNGTPAKRAAAARKAFEIIRDEQSLRMGIAA